MVYFLFYRFRFLIYFVYQLLENVEQDKRLLLSSLAGFWYSTIYADYFINNFSWGLAQYPFLCSFLPYSIGSRWKRVSRCSIRL
jgi:hypothetical protein